MSRLGYWELKPAVVEQHRQELKNSHLRDEFLSNRISECWLIAVIITIHVVMSGRISFTNPRTSLNGWRSD